VGKRQEQIGDVRLHKEVISEQQSVPVTLRHEEVTVERVPFTGQASQSDLQNAFKNKDIDVPMMGEEAVVGKQLHETEEVRLHKQATQTPVADQPTKEGQRDANGRSDGAGRAREATRGGTAPTGDGRGNKGDAAGRPVFTARDD